MKENPVTNFNIDNKETIPVKTKISVCTPTYKRPILLKKLLDSLQTQTLPEGIVLEIIVVDNDSEKSAEEIIKNFKDSSIECRYYLQPEKNISITRNMAVKEAAGDFLLFIDDDIYAGPDLIKHYVESQEKFNADVLFGVVKPYFDEGTPDWVKQEEFYYSHIGKTGTNAKTIRGGNTFVKAHLMKQFDKPFDIKYGLSGSEDSHFFSKLQKQGYKLLNCKEAVTWEFIPSDRTTPKYLFSRAFRGGNGFIRRTLDEAENNRTSIILEHFFKGVLQIIFYSIKYIFVFFSKKKRFISLLKIYSNAGKVMGTWGYVYEGYK